MRGAVGGEAEQGGGSEDDAGVGGRKVILAEVEAGAEQQGAIGAVVDEELGAGLPAEERDGAGEGEGFAGPGVFVPELEDACAAFKKGLRREERIESEAVQRGGIEDGIDTGEQVEIIPDWTQA